MTPPLHRVLTALFLATLGLSAACATSDDQDPSASGTAVIGAIYSTRGGQASMDDPSSQGALLAVHETNRNGGVLGQPLTWVLEDGESRAEVVAQQTTALLQRYPSTCALMGLSDTDLVLAAAPIAAARGRVFVTSGATSPKLPEQVPEWLFLACFGDNVQAAAAAEFAVHDLGARTAAILYDTTHAYTRLLQGYFRTRFEQLGGRIVSDVGMEMERLAGAVDELGDADVVFLSTEAVDDALAGVARIRAAGFTGPILGGDGYDAAEAWSRHPDITDVYFTTHAWMGVDNPDPKVVAFRAAYTSAFPDSEPDAFSALGYDTVRLLVTAIDAAGSTDPDAVREALAGIRSFEGVTGTMSYPPGARIPLKTVTILEVKGGQVTLAKQLVPQEVPAP